MLLHRAIDVFCAASLINLGILLLLPISTYARFTTYITMAGIASEEAWGTVFLVAGAAWLGGMVLRRGRLAMIGMLGSFALRLTQSLLVGEATQFEAPGTWDFLWWAISCGWCYFRTIWRSPSDEDSH